MNSVASIARLPSATKANATRLEVQSINNERLESIDRLAEYETVILRLKENYDCDRTISTTCSMGKRTEISVRRLYRRRLCFRDDSEPRKLCMSIFLATYKLLWKLCSQPMWTRATELLWTLMDNRGLLMDSTLQHSRESEIIFSGNINLVSHKVPFARNSRKTFSLIEFCRRCLFSFSLLSFFRRQELNATLEQSNRRFDESEQFF